MPKKRLSTIAKEIQKYSETITAGVVEIGRCLCEVKSLLSDVMGHSNVSTTAIYTRMTREQQQDAVNKTINW